MERCPRCGFPVVHPYELCHACWEKERARPRTGGPVRKDLLKIIAVMGALLGGGVLIMLLSYAIIELLD